MKGKILSELRVRNETVSGEYLSSTLGISRVSIWKHIHKLQELGYNIVSTPNGYQLIDSPDILYPWELPDREDRIHYFPELTSTMDTARDLARKNCPEFSVVVAGRQTAGRGRLNRQWLSDDGGLYFTIVLRPDIAVPISSRVNFLASLTMARVLRDKYKIDAAVKWPNDILVDDQKLSGMLSELEAEADRVFFINVGMGINVNNNPSGIEPAAISLKTLLGREVSRIKLLTAFLDEFEKRLINTDFESVVSEWKQYTITLQRRVKIVTRRETCEGLALDVDDNGALIVKRDDGTLKQVIYGDCFHQ
ncbi:MAG: biotin--[acetyl-CoA-carboxylase] ligase [Deltaproteobacteria bacterium]|nr:biotin--[acetyl-CoA-carboxylase] ligase [Deltaproteobacteria bacterium]